ncbi:translation initiation factor IF-2 [Patescibacteria group bacterium]|nr:translation initiation factor IF-2 [Patescibacteria group bacterium]
MNITELARRLKVPTQQLKDELPRLGFDIGQRAIKIDDAVAGKVIKLWQNRRQAVQEDKYVVIEKRLNKTEDDSKKREVLIPSRISPRDFAALLKLPVTSVMAELFKNGVMASINEVIDFETASIIAQDLGYVTTQATEQETTGQEETESANLKELIKDDKETDLEPRPPVVVVMGHVDHGKTTLLDAIRSANVAAYESGAITQHIGAYQVEAKGRKITFLDTPGHEAFSSMRARGGRLADVAIIVVAADDGLQPQTLEAIEIAQKEKLPFLVAINKIDRETADIERVKKSLSEVNLLPEDWGGKTICVPISAKKNEGITEVLDMVLLLADLEKLQANPNRLAVGTVIEAKLDKGEGPVATVLVRTGTLKIGDLLIVGAIGGKVKGMRDFTGQVVKIATPAMPVRILGLKQTPQAGDIFKVVDNEEEVRAVLRKAPRFQRSPQVNDKQAVVVTEEEKEADQSISVNIILKTDVLGSREALLGSLSELSNDEVKVKVIKTALGSISEADIIQAEGSRAIVMGFNVPLQPAAQNLARTKKVFVQTYKVIYDLLDEVKKQLNALLKPELVRHQLGVVEVIKIFRQTKSEQIIGVRVVEGTVRAKTKIHLLRNSQPVVGTWDLQEVRLGKEMVGEVGQGGECGLSLKGRVPLLVNDRLEIYHEEIRQRVIGRQTS